MEIDGNRSFFKFGKQIFSEKYVMKEIFDFSSRKKIKIDQRVCVPQNFYLYQTVGENVRR
jgi:hypothetical protein